MTEPYNYYGNIEPTAHPDSPLNRTLIPLLFIEGFSVDNHNNLIITAHIDFRMPQERSPVGAVLKYSPERFSIEGSKTIKIARPSHFRRNGETLIYDTGEGRATKESVTQSESPISDDERAMTQSLDDDVNRAIKLSGNSGARIKTTLHTGTITHTHREYLEWGQEETWIFCTAMEPTSDDERQALLESLESDYDHVSYVISPREFAQMLGRAYVEHYGAPKDKMEPMKHSFNGAYVGTTYHPAVSVFHGPVVYVDDPYATYTYAEAASNPWEKMLLPIFTKEKKFSGQREYRFVILDKNEYHSDFKIMPATPGLLATIGTHGDGKGPMVIPDFDTTGAEVVPPATTSGSLRMPHLPKQSIDSTDMARQYTASPVIPNCHKVTNGEEPPNDFDEMVGVYPAVATLREKIDHSLLGIAATHPRRKPQVTSAAWYAEYAIRQLCHRFENPIRGISITDDNCIVIEIRLSHWNDSECKLAVMPSGAYALTLKRKSTGNKMTRASGTSTGARAMSTSLSEDTLNSIANFEP